MPRERLRLRPPRDEDFPLISRWISADSAGAAYTGDVGENVSRNGSASCTSPGP